MIDLPPQIVHYPHGDADAGDITFTAIVTDDRSTPDTELHFKEVDSPTFSDITMSQTVNPEEYSATQYFPEGSYEYYISAVDSFMQIVYTDTFQFDVGLCGTAIIYDDGLPEGYNWANETEFEWAVKVEPANYPFILCGATVAVAASHPGVTHSPFQVRVLDSDGVDNFPGTELWNELTGSIGNVIGGIQPGTVHWAEIVIGNGGTPLTLEQPFYIAVSNPEWRKYEAFGRDDSSPGVNSYFFDGCEMQWYSETAEHQNATGGTRMIRPIGYSLPDPNGLTIQRSGSDIVLRWNDVGAPAYRVMRSASSHGEFLEFVGSTTETTITDTGILQTNGIMYYKVFSVSER